jgi:hypothetical protein
MVWKMCLETAKIVETGKPSSLKVISNFALWDRGWNLPLGPNS